MIFFVLFFLMHLFLVHVTSFFRKKIPAVLAICLFSISKILFANEMTSVKPIFSENSNLISHNELCKALTILQKNKVQNDVINLLRSLSNDCSSLSNLSKEGSSTSLDNFIINKLETNNLCKKQEDINTPFILFAGQNIINSGGVSSTSSLPKNKTELAISKQKKVIVDSDGLIANFITLFFNWKKNAQIQFKKIGNVLFAVPKLFLDRNDFYRVWKKIQMAWESIHYFFIVLILAWMTEWCGSVALKKKHALLYKKVYLLSLQESDESIYREEICENHSSKRVAVESKPLIAKISSQLYEEKKIKQLLYATTRFTMDLFPLLLFYLVSGLGLWLLSSSSNFLTGYFSIFANAYFFAKLTVVTTKLITSPDFPLLRLIDFSNDTANFIQRWVNRLAVLVVFSYLGHELTLIFELPDDFHVAWVKLFGLVFHSSLILVVFQSRRFVSPVLDDSNPGLIEMAKRFFATAWVWIASGLIVAMWVLWVFGLEDGFQRIVYFLARTIFLLILAYLLLLFINALLLAFFGEKKPDMLDNCAKSTSINSALDLSSVLRRHRLHMILKYAAFFVVIFGDGLFLLDTWDFKIIDWLAHNPVGVNITSATCKIFFSVLISFVTWELVNLMIENRLKNWQISGDGMRAGRLRTLLPMLRMLLIVLLLLLLGLTILRELGVDTTPLLAGASLIGVAIGFGSQKLIQDFVTGIFLLMENAIQLGDLITVAGTTGIVEHLSIRAVRIRSPDGSLNTIPFSSVTIVNNVNRGIANALFRIALAHPVDVDKVKEIFIKIAHEMRQEPPFDQMILDSLDWWGVDTINGASVTVVAQLRTMDDARLKVQREFNRRLIEYLNKEKIELDNPQSYVFKKSTTSL